MKCYGFLYVGPYWMKIIWVFAKGLIVAKIVVDFVGGFAINGSLEGFSQRSVVLETYEFCIRKLIMDESLVDSHSRACSK